MPTDIATEEAIRVILTSLKASGVIDDKALAAVILALRKEAKTSPAWVSASLESIADRIDGA